jgi:hypothetical protein
VFLKTSDQEKFELGYGNYSCNWGIHVAGLYETEEERDEIIFGFLGEGIQKKDLQLYVPAEQSREKFITNFSQSCPGCKNSLQNHEVFRFFDAKELYYPDGFFSPKAMDVGLNELYKNTQKNGKRNIRVAAEMVWALDAVMGKEHLFAYESRLNYFIPHKPWISICLYNITKFYGATIMDVLHTHPYTLNKGILMENPYFQDPDIWLKENAPQFLNENMI